MSDIEQHGRATFGGAGAACLERDATAPAEASLHASLSSLLEHAGRLELGGDVLAWQHLRAEASAAIAALISAGIVPGHLALRADEPAVVLQRTLVAASRYTTGWRRRPREVYGA